MIDEDVESSQDSPNVTKDLFNDKIDSSEEIQRNSEYCEKDKQTKSHHSDEAMGNIEWDPNSTENPRNPKKLFQPCLPNIEAVIAKVKWATVDISSSENGLSKDDSMKKMGEYVKMTLNSPPNPETRSIQKEGIHVENERHKSLYGRYVNANGEDNVPDALEILRAVSQKVKREYIDSFYRTGPQKFIIVLKNKKFKDFYIQELTFQEKILGMEHNFRIFSNLPNTKRFTERNRHPYSVYITMHLSTIVSDTNVRKAFDHCRVVHNVFQGTYKKDFHEIKNG